MPHSENMSKNTLSSRTFWRDDEEASNINGSCGPVSGWAILPTCFRDDCFRAWSNHKTYEIAYFLRWKFSRAKFGSEDIFKNAMKEFSINNENIRKLQLDLQDQLMFALMPKPNQL